jgi:D-alanine-D-alanine ligase
MKVAIIYNQPESDRYHAFGESKAELGVLDEVNAVSQALDELKYPYVLVSLRPPLGAVKETIQAIDADVIFNLFEGFDGCPETEGKVAGMLAERKIPFTGCPAEALTLALDKARAKERFEKSGIPTARYQVLNLHNIADFHLKFPCIVKPLGEDASHGISEDSVVADFSALEKQVGKICALFGGRALVEEYLDGREFNTTVMGHGRLTVPAISEIVYTLPPDKPRVLTFEGKWEENSLYFDNTRAVCPADISLAEQNEIGQIAKAAFRLVGCQGYARVDFRQDKAGNFKVLEVNPNPDITPGSGAALQAATSGMTYSQFIGKIIRLALKYNNTNN